MAFGGRGRGRGFGGGWGFRSAKQEPFILFPDIENLPDARNVTEELSLIMSSSKFQKFWNSAHYLEDKMTHKDESSDIARFSDKHKQSTKRKRGLPETIVAIGEYFPEELVQDSKRGRHAQKKIRWNPEPDLKMFDLIEEREKKSQGQEGKGGKENKEGEDEEEEDEGTKEEDEEYSDDGDYDQNVDFDDDDDDYNMDDDNNNEDIF